MIASVYDSYQPSTVPYPLNFTEELKIWWAICYTFNIPGTRKEKKPENKTRGKVQISIATYHAATLLKIAFSLMPALRASTIGNFIATYFHMHNRDCVVAELYAIPSFICVRNEIHKYFPDKVLKMNGFLCDSCIYFIHLKIVLVIFRLSSPLSTVFFRDKTSPVLTSFL